MSTAWRARAASLALVAGVLAFNPDVTKAGPRETLCLVIESSARDHQIPVQFFSRLIWQESRFDPDAIGPLTRSGQRAQGIAQFMPGTATERQLLDPFDPVQALPRSAEFLRDLRAQFGNLGLAAAAYNAGPRRVQEWLEGRGYMPTETRRYVLSITGRPIEDWVDTKDQQQEHDSESCLTLLASGMEKPGAFLAALEDRVRLSIASPWGVQLAAGFSRAKGLLAFSRAARQFSGALQGREPMIVTSVLRSRGTRSFYQVRVGAQTRTEADAVCARVRNDGGACMVVRNASKPY